MQKWSLIYSSSILSYIQYLARPCGTAKTDPIFYKTGPVPEEVLSQSIDSFSYLSSSILSYFRKTARPSLMEKGRAAKHLCLTAPPHPGTCVPLRSITLPCPDPFTRILSGKSSIPPGHRKHKEIFYSSPPGASIQNWGRLRRIPKIPARAIMTTQKVISSLPPPWTIRPYQAHSSARRQA